mmetsp:Transcript_54289/g.97034  ORF Transcript_54289/g.97034 Transcript_54289/m.97034 type:complete len:257 (+) Transcript_54289:1315-2085(+)
MLSNSVSVKFPLAASLISFSRFASTTGGSPLFSRSSSSFFLFSSSCCFFLRFSSSKALILSASFLFASASAPASITPWIAVISSVALLSRSLARPTAFASATASCSAASFAAPVTPKASSRAYSASSSSTSRATALAKTSSAFERPAILALAITPCHEPTLPPFSSKAFCSSCFANSHFLASSSFRFLAASSSSFRFFSSSSAFDASLVFHFCQAASIFSRSLRGSLLKSSSVKPLEPAVVLWRKALNSDSLAQSL